MDNNKNNTTKDNKNNEVEVFNDQLGENASEEFRSEEYANAMKNKDKNKEFK